MVFVNSEVCNGCGECVGICPNDALIFQNNRAFVDQELCQSCELCLEACPQGAILSGDRIPATQDVIHIPEVAPEQYETQLTYKDQISVRDVVLPAISSILLWAGRELVPRLASTALGYLDRRIQPSQSISAKEHEMHEYSSVSTPVRRNRRRRQRRYFRNYRKPF